MAIVLYKRPSNRNWSGNPIHYQLFSAAAEAAPENFFEYRIYFKRTDEADYSLIVELPFYPVKGTADIDIEKVLEGLLEYEVPYINDNLVSPFNTGKTTGMFYITWREITTAVPDPAWTETESANAKFVIKGGISFEKWRGDNYWVNYFEPLKPFLTWQLSGRLAGLEERMYLAWLNTTSVDPGDIKLKRTVVFTDTTSYVLDIGCPVNANEITYIPAGAKQLKLDEVFPTKKIWYWELQLWDTDANIPISEKFKYELDNNYYYPVPGLDAVISLNYRNSIAGLDSFRVTGTVDSELQREFTEQGQVVMHDYFAGHFIKGRVKAANSGELLVYKGDIGHLTKEEHDRLRDIHLRRDLWWEQDGTWLPVMTMTGNQKLNSSDDMRWGMPIEFSIASGLNKYYTPRKINLQDGSLPNVNPCSAIISVPTYSGTGPWTVNWLLVSGSPIKYQVSTPAVSGGAPHDTTSLSYVFNWLPVGDNIIKVQPVCFIGGQYYLGTPQYVTITVAPACVPVGISGSPVLPSATEGVAYTYSFALTGSAPFVLANIIKPNWMTIAITGGNNVEFSGTPGPSDSGTGIEVNFDIKNCSNNNFVNFTQDIDVIDAGHNFTVINAITGWTINGVSPTIYTISSGAFPIIPGAAVVGDHTAHNGVIAVVLSKTGAVDANLKIYVNGALQETIPVSASGSYAFATHNYLLTDTIEIRLIS